MTELFRMLAKYGVEMHIYSGGMDRLTVHYKRGDKNIAAEIDKFIIEKYQDGCAEEFLLNTLKRLLKSCASEDFPLYCALVEDSLIEEYDTIGDMTGFAK